MENTIESIKKNLDKAKFVVKNGGTPNIIYFCQLEKDIPAVSMVGDPDMLIPAIASLVHNLTLNIGEGKTSENNDDAMLLTIRQAIKDIYWRN